MMKQVTITNLNFQSMYKSDFVIFIMQLIEVLGS